MATSSATSTASKQPRTNKPTSLTPSRPSPSLSSHLAMIELKQRILTSISKLSDRDTHQIAIQDLQSIATSLSSQDSLPMFLNTLYDCLSHDSTKLSVKKDALHLLSFVASSHTDLAYTHLTKIISSIIKRLKDSDSGVKDACRDAIGSLSKLYLKDNEADNNNNSSSSNSNVSNYGVVGLFAKPLFEAMGEQNKGAQSGAAMCMASMVECASDKPVLAFQKLCPRICKLLNSQNFLAKASLLPVVASLSQVGAIAPQSFDTLLQSIHECLKSTDWATRKAAADTLIVLATHSSDLVTDGAASTLAVLDSCRFDKIKPARDSITEALQLWKKVAGKGDGVSDDQKASSHDSEPSELSGKTEPLTSKTGEKHSESTAKDDPNAFSPTSDSNLKAKSGNLLDKAIGILKKKPPPLTDKEINPDFFQKLETRRTDDLPVEVVVPQRCQNSSNPCNEKESDPRNSESSRISNQTASSEPDDASFSANIRYRNIERATNAPFSKRDSGDSAHNKWADERFNGNSKMRGFESEDDRMELNQRELSGRHAGFTKSDGQSEGPFMNGKGNWLAIQRQLLHLERQQSHLMNMLQDFMGGSHDNMITLESRVRGLERVVEDMARDLSFSSGRRGSNFIGGYEGSSNRPVGKYNGFPDYSGSKLGRGGDGRVSYGERFGPSDGIASSARGRGPPWRSDMSEALDFHSYGASRSGQMGSRRNLGGGSGDVRSPKSDHEKSDQVSGRRAWDKAVGGGPLRLGEGPSARSVWQASKDEATLEAIRVAGDDTGSTRNARVAIPELTAEAMGDDNVVQERGPIWTSWTNAMDALQVGDIDSAFAEVLSTEDDLLLVKLMDRSGPVVDQLSDEVASEVLHTVGQFVLEQNLCDIGLSWIQQLVEVLVDNGADAVRIPIEVKRELLLNLHEASSTMDPPEDWEGATPDQLMFQLASTWGIDMQQFEK